MQNSKIEWTDTTWNPVTGCTKVSQGCKHCYAERLYERFNGKGSFKKVKTHPERLNQPFKLKTPQRIFVNSMSDLFHEDVSFEFIDVVFSVMSSNPQHTFQVLTKRPHRMLEFYQWKAAKFNISWQPSDNVWIGVSVEDQENANQRLPYLNLIYAKVKFVSCEPLLGPVDFEKALGESLKWHAGGLANCISWVIIGGESGPGARPMHPNWVEDILIECCEANIPVFFKQWGEYRPFIETAQAPFYKDCNNANEFDSHIMNFINPLNAEAGRFAGHKWMDSFEAILYCAEHSSQLCAFLKMGKSKSGNEFYGITYNHFPTV